MRFTPWSSISHASFGRPPRSQSVRASSRRWSKNRMLSSAASSGRISRSMKSSSSTRYAARSEGISKSITATLVVDAPISTGQHADTMTNGRDRTREQQQSEVNDQTLVVWLLYRMRVALLALAALAIIATVGYVALEGYGWIDATYMTVITLGTIGYGEVHPLG